MAQDVFYVNRDNTYHKIFEKPNVNKIYLSKHYEIGNRVEIILRGYKNYEM